MHLYGDVACSSLGAGPALRCDVLSDDFPSICGVGVGIWEVKMVRHPQIPPRALRMNTKSKLGDTNYLLVKISIFWLIKKC